MKKEEEVQETPETPKGREAFMAYMKEKNPEYSPENDDQFFDDIHAMHGEMKSELENHRSTNSKLSEHVAKDPRNGALLSMMNEGKSVPYSVAKLYGQDLKGMEGQDMEEWETGFQESLNQLSESQKLQEQAQDNFVESIGRIEKYCEANGYDETKKNDLIEAITSYAEELLMGKIADSLIEEIAKGQNYDQDIQEAAETGKVEGLNQKMDMVLEKPSDMPDMKATTKNSSARKPVEKKSFYEKLA